MAESDLFNWRVPIAVAAGGLIVFLPLVISGPFLGEFLYLSVAVPVVSLALLILGIRKKGRQRLSALCMLLVYWGVSAVLVRNHSAARDAARWLLWSKGYKAEVLVQPGSASGELKHVEWDGWGFPGAGNTVVYLVFDPNDSLAVGAKSHLPGRFTGIPCEVPWVHRLENHWYSVMFYTDTDWGHCS